MKKHLVILFLSIFTIISSTCYAGTNGFLNYPWGTDFEEMRDLFYAEVPTPLQAYSEDIRSNTRAFLIKENALKKFRKEWQPRFDDRHIPYESDIMPVFYKGKLVYVSAYFKGTDYSDGAEYFTSLYGMPHKKTSDGPVSTFYVWRDVDNTNVVVWNMYGNITLTRMSMDFYALF